MKNITCPITCEPFEHPIIIPCGHTFERRAMYEITNEKCPLCRKKFNRNQLPDYPINYIITDLMKESTDDNQLINMGSIKKEIENQIKEKLLIELQKDEKIKQQIKSEYLSSPQLRKAMEMEARYEIKCKLRKEINDDTFEELRVEIKNDLLRSNRGVILKNNVEIDYMSELKQNLIDNLSEEVIYNINKKAEEELKQSYMEDQQFIDNCKLECEELIKNKLINELSIERKSELLKEVENNYKQSKLSEIKYDFEENDICRLSDSTHKQALIIVNSCKVREGHLYLRFSYTNILSGSDGIYNYASRNGNFMKCYKIGVDEPIINLVKK